MASFDREVVQGGGMSVQPVNAAQDRAERARAPTGSMSWSWSLRDDWTLRPFEVQHARWVPAVFTDSLLKSESFMCVTPSSVRGPVRGADTHARRVLAAARGAEMMTRFFFHFQLTLVCSGVEEFQFVQLTGATRTSLRPEQLSLHETFIYWTQEFPAALWK